MYAPEAVEALCFVLSRITWWENFAAVKINEAVGKRIWKASKIRYVVRNEQHRFVFHLVRFIMFINITVLRLRNTDRKSSSRLPSAPIRNENGALQTGGIWALRFRVDGKHFENGAFQERCRHDNHEISQFESSSSTNPKCVKSARCLILLTNHYQADRC